jgi:hypothetical protein
MAKTSEGKVGLFIYLDKEVAKKLRELVKSKYQGQWGISWEVEEAIRAWLRLQHAQIHTQPLNPGRPHVHQVMDAIIFKLREMGCLVQCSVNDLRRAINEVRGSDERTFKKWAEILVKEGRLKWIGTYTYEIV